MNPYVDINKGVFPVSEFRKEISQMIKNTRESHRPTLLTEYGKSSAVVIGAEDYQDLLERMELNENLIKGLEDYDEGRVYSGKDAMKKAMEGFE